MKPNSETQTKIPFFDNEANPLEFKFLKCESVSQTTAQNPTCHFKDFLKCKFPGSNEIKGGTYALHGYYMEYYKDECDIQSQTKISLLYATLENLCSDSQELDYGFAVTRQGRRYEFYSEEREMIEKWVDALKRVCILTGFYENYKVLKAIGKGSFAKVYLAESKSTNQNFAIKSLKKEGTKATPHSHIKKSILNEIEIMRMLNHDNIIKLHEVYETDSSVHLILDYVEGKTLEETLKDRAFFKDEHYEVTVFNIMRAILEALIYLSSKGIMHRDLKPGNILLEKGEKVKVFDFGISSLINADEYLFKKCGTPGYMAPEVFVFDEEDESTRYSDLCDVFSTGTIFFELLCGKPLFLGANVTETIKLNKHFSYKNNILHAFQQKRPSSLKRFSKETFSLASRLLEPDQHMRISAEEAIRHPYFTPAPNGMLRYGRSNEFVQKAIPSISEDESYPNLSLRDLYSFCSPSKSTEAEFKFTVSDSSYASPPKAGAKHIEKIISKSSEEESTVDNSPVATLYNSPSTPVKPENKIAGTQRRRFQIFSEKTQKGLVCSQKE